MGDRFTTQVHVVEYILGFILLFMWFDFIQCNLGEMAKQSRQNAPDGDEVQNHKSKMHVTWKKSCKRSHRLN